MTEQVRFEDAGELKEFTILPKPSVFVAVYYYPASDQPYCNFGTNKEELIKSMYNWGGLDRSRAIRIYTITP